MRLEYRPRKSSNLCKFVGLLLTADLLDHSQMSKHTNAKIAIVLKFLFQEKIEESLESKSA